MGLRIAAALFALCLVSLGCGGYSGTLEKSGDLLWPERADLDKGSQLSGAERRMARIVYPLDTRLQSLIQAARTWEPGTEGADELAGLASRFPWISGALVVDPEGEVQRSRPEGREVRLALGDIVDKARQWRDRELHALYGKSRYGADTVLLTGLYSGGERSGYLLVPFDFSALAEHSPRAEELVAISRGHVLWPGDFGAAAERLAEADWDARLEDGAWGRCRVEDRRFYWLARYIGQQPFVYAVEIQGTD